MHSWQLLPALVVLASATCYHPDGREADEEWLPCNKIEGFSFCCRDGDTCLDSGLCRSASGLELGACQNSGWSGCHKTMPNPAELRVRQDAPPPQSTVVVGQGVPPPQSTVVVVATRTSSILPPTTATSEPPPATSTDTQPTTPPSSDSSSSSNLGAIIGGAVGGAVGLVIFLGLVWLFCARRKKHRARREARDALPSPEMMTPTMTTSNGTESTYNWRRPIITRDRRGPHVTQGLNVAEIDGSPITEAEKPVKMKQDNNNKTKDAAEMDDGRKGDLPVELDDTTSPLSEMDDGRRLEVPVEMDAEGSTPTAPGSPWTVQKGVYEMC
ncbi:hypothetical protein BGZ63DRAFT_57558 [Mariannaea sp. PMI_226]|nr:hypothetical protein BGZ63DRAFT_57558 [Mariannaea sp. PMI_226]